MSRTLTLRINDPKEVEALDHIIHATGCKSASKALMRVCDEYIKYVLRENKDASLLTLYLQSEEQRMAIENIKNETGSQSVEEAIINCCENFSRLNETNKKLLADNQRLRNENIRLRKYAQAVIDAGNAVQKIMEK